MSRGFVAAEAAMSSVCQLVHAFGLVYNPLTADCRKRELQRILRAAALGRPRVARHVFRRRPTLVSSLVIAVCLTPGDVRGGIRTREGKHTEGIA